MPEFGQKPNSLGTAETDEATIATPVAESRWPLWVAFGLVLVGLVASVTVLLLQPMISPKGEPQVARIPRPEKMFSRIQSEIATAPSSEARIQAALDMVDFLLRAVDWQPENDRQRMAREYLLALADLDTAGPSRFLVVRQLFDLATLLQDSELLTSGENLLRREPVEEEPIPFDLLCAETDALLDLGDPAMAYARIDELGTRVSERTDTPRVHLLRVVRGLRRALEDEEAMTALRAHRKAGGQPNPDREAILAELAEKAAVLAACGTVNLEVEGLWNQAYLARQHGEIDAEIDFLQKIIEKGPTSIRPLAYMQLTDRMRDDEHDPEYVALLRQMIDDSELRKFAMAELQKRLRLTATEEVARELLESVDQVLELGDELAQPLAQLLLAASEMALEQGWLPLAERYLDVAETLTLDRELLAENMLMQAEIALARGDRNAMIRDYKEVISLYPGHPKEADIRFLLLQEMAAQPFSEADLVGGIIGAITRLPKDSRGIRGLLMVAHRLEDLELYELAETYYRLSVLLSTLQQARDDSGGMAEALMGQARSMAKQGKYAEADSLLRVVNTNVRWADIWSTSGPLWTTLAFRQGQFREGVRRWRQTCGPPGGELLPYLFERLVPDLSEWSAPTDTGTPRRPGRMPQDLVETAVDAVLDQMLLNNDFAEAERLMGLIEADPEWADQLPVMPYRARILERMAANEPLVRTAEWLELHPIPLPAEASPETLELTKWLENVHAIIQRTQSLHP